MPKQQREESPVIVPIPSSDTQAEHDRIREIERPGSAARARGEDVAPQQGLRRSGGRTGHTEGAARRRRALTSSSRSGPDGPRCAA